MHKLIAVYGSLREGLHNHCVLNGAEKVGNTIIKGWDMFSLGGFPYVLKGEGDVVIEVYKVDNSDTLEDLDCLEGYPTFYDRVDDLDTEFGKASMYFMHNHYTVGNPAVESGDWFDYITNGGR